MYVRIVAGEREGEGEGREEGKERRSWGILI